ncbi:cell envelope integrity protein TolA [Halomonas sp. TBZ9]|uniref:Cell envelope integrity protein TolA n=1 Tax=Vreelandella azerica TaxID=2732867 RepID=A0A7Y3U0C1_9GAMM|nr:cell envelope integrity protein TolA [Halomonas azerica]NOG32782.1 cell envelope integrity protein TolA [Halomonas azerica]
MTKGKKTIAFLGRKRHKSDVGYGLPLILAVTLHALVVGLSVISLPSQDDTPESSSIVQATLVSTETFTDQAQQPFEQPTADVPEESQKTTLPDPGPTAQDIATEQAEAQRQREAEAEAQRQREAEAQRQREAEAEAQRQREAEAEAQRQREAEAEAQRQREAEAQRQREAEAQRQREAEAEAQRQREAEAEAQRQREAEAEAQRQREAEAEAQRQREAEAEAQRQREAEAEAQRQRESEAQRQRQREAEAEAQRQREAEAQRQREAEAEAQRQREAEAQRLREAEEARRAAELAERARQAEQAQNSFTNIVKNLVEQAWIIPPGASNNAAVTLNIRLGPSGEVLATSVVSSSGDGSFDRSAQQAVEQAAPFSELRDVPAEFQRNLRQFNLRFTPGMFADVNVKTNRDVAGFVSVEQHSVC